MSYPPATFPSHPSHPSSPSHPSHPSPPLTWKHSREVSILVAASVAMRYAAEMSWRAESRKRTAEHKVQR